jgi:hypothetical protein
VSFSLYPIDLADAMKLDVDDDFVQILGTWFPGVDTQVAKHPLYARSP